MKISPAVPLGAAGAKNLEFLTKNQFFTVKNYIFFGFRGGGASAPKARSSLRNCGSIKDVIAKNVITAVCLSILARNFYIHFEVIHVSGSETRFKLESNTAGCLTSITERFNSVSLRISLCSAAFADYSWYDIF